MASSGAFQPLTNTVVLSPTTSTQQVALPSTVGAGLDAIRVSNQSTQDIYITTGTSGSVTSAVPIVGTPSAAIHIPAKDVEVFLPNWGVTNIAVIQAVAGTGNVFFVQGTGV